jgi:SAM-dependent methyltransferase
VNEKTRRDDEIRRSVRESYAKRATSSGCGCGGSCCSSAGATSVSRAVGYSDEDLEAVPAGADLGLGCGNPTALASLREGDVVLDLGSGAGIDCFLAADKIGETGRAIGVDMTPEMIERARENARTEGATNVEFRLGEIEHLPVADNTVDAIISNCVVNLVPDKAQVFADAFRVLKPGGRISLSDIVLKGELPDDIRESLELYAACVAGASHVDDYLGAIREAGFHDVAVVREQSADSAFERCDPAGAPNRGPTVFIDGRATKPEEVGLTDEMALRLAGLVSSVCVSASKR